MRSERDLLLGIATIHKSWGERICCFALPPSTRPAGLCRALSLNFHCGFKPTPAKYLPEACDSSRRLLLATYVGTFAAPPPLLHTSSVRIVRTTTWTVRPGWLPSSRRHSHDNTPDYVIHGAFSTWMWNWQETVRLPIPYLPSRESRCHLSAPYSSGSRVGKKHEYIAMIWCPLPRSHSAIDRTRTYL
ncbi:hypothetical protein F4802DRAFT_386078 [Xylaria palmicola]|nr:hypothetical protein F4802DRAFT_386078 [Xylaria palmicola]